MAGRATGERIDGPRKRRVIELAANEVPETKIAIAAKLDRSTVRAIKLFESDSIQQRKTILAEQSATIAHLAAERLKREVSTMPIGSLIPAFGVSVDKLCAITQEPQSQANSHLHIHLDKSDAISEWNEFVRSVKVADVVHSNIARDASTEQKQISAKEIEAKPAQSNTNSTTV